MMLSRLRIFHIVDGGENETLKKWFGKTKKQSMKMSEFLKNHNAKNFLQLPNGKLAGCTFERKPNQTIWKKLVSIKAQSGEKAYKPRTKTTEHLEFMDIIKNQVIFDNVGHEFLDFKTKCNVIEDRDKDGKTIYFILVPKETKRFRDQKAIVEEYVKIKEKYQDVIREVKPSEFYLMKGM